MDTTKGQYEYLRIQAKQTFNKVRGTWLELGRWALPHRIKWMLSQTPGERNNQHIADASHIITLRTFKAGFLEGNTSASRPWFRIFSKDEDKNKAPNCKEWLQHYTNRVLAALSSCNFYNAAGSFYEEYGVFNTGAHYIDELETGLYFHNLDPGSYFVINNGYNEAVVMVREFSLSVKALVTKYGKKDKSGNWDWSNFSPRVRKCYENGNYTQMIDITHIIKENEKYDASKPQVLLNKKWISATYELGSFGGQYYQEGQEYGAAVTPDSGVPIYLKKTASKRKPFIVGKSDSSGNFEYGEKGPTLDSLGLIKSLNKKALGKDQALEQMLRPAMQGPASLKKSYITTAPNSYIPLDPTSLSQKGLRSVFDINPGIGALIQDVSDMRAQVDKLYYADYLRFLSENPKTRTATETNAVVQEQQLVLGPLLQSLNWTYNVPVVEFVMDYVLDSDPYLKPPPQELAGQFLKAEFISVFAQAQKAADLPAIDRYMAKIMEIGQQQGGAHVWDKANIDKFCDLYEDRLFLPAGLNNPQGKVDAMRQQAMAMQQKQEMMQKTLPALAGASKDMGSQIPQQQQ